MVVVKAQQPSGESGSVPSTPCKPAQCPDGPANFITSARKRKAGEGLAQAAAAAAPTAAAVQAAQPEKKVRQDGGCDEDGSDCAPPHLQSPGPPAKGLARTAPGLDPAHPNHDHPGGEEGALFSPTFHLHLGSPSEAEAASRDDISHCSTAAPTAAPPQPQNSDAGAGQQQQQQQPCEGPPPTEGHSSGTSTGTSSPPELEDGGVDCMPTDAAAAAAAADGAGSGVLVPAGTAVAVAASPPEEEDEDDYFDFDPLLFIKRLPPVEQCVAPRTTFLLPRQTRRSKQKTLVLDLDETLVHSTLDPGAAAGGRPDFTFPVEVGAARHLVAVRQRPFLHDFLRRVATLYEVVVFTASQRIYAERLLDLVDPERCLIRHRVFRESCVFWEGNYLKDLTVLGRDLAHTMIVDNSPQAFGFQLDNGIPIESWYDDDDDRELMKLLPFLEHVASQDDVRPHIQRRYNLRKLVDRAGQAEEGGAAAVAASAAP